MVEFKNNYSFAGLLLAFAVIVSGVVYNLVPTGNYKVCDNGVGWQLDSNTGQYACGDRKYDCVAVRNTKTGKPNYYCDEATRVEVKIEEVVVQPSCPAERVCPDFISYTDSGKTFCRRYSDGTQKCTKEYPY